MLIETYNLTSLDLLKNTENCYSVWNRVKNSIKIIKSFQYLKSITNLTRDLYNFVSCRVLTKPQLINLIKIKFRSNQLNQIHSNFRLKNNLTIDLAIITI